MTIHAHSFGFLGLKHTKESKQCSRLWTCTAGCASTRLLRAFVRRARPIKLYMSFFPGRATGQLLTSTACRPADLSLRALRAPLVNEKQTGIDLPWQEWPARVELSCWAKRVARKLNKQQACQAHTRQNAPSSVGLKAAMICGSRRG